MATTLSIIREESEGTAIRCSIGGKPDVGYYCIFRGDPKLIAEMLEHFCPHVIDEVRNKRYNDNRRKLKE